MRAISRTAASILALLAASLPLGPARAQTPERTDAAAVFGKPALPVGFKNFPYVNPDAPKGGDVTLGALGSFDSFNPFIVRGTAASETTKIYDTLMRPSDDEASVAYGHLAKAIEIAPDHRSVTFELRPEAKFHDGSPVTAEDVAWTFNMMRSKGRPMFGQYYADVKDVTVDSPSRVTFHFATADNRELPVILGEVVVLPKHWWATRDFSAPLTDAPLGSGPYRLDRFEFGRDTVLKRVPDYWAKDLPTAKGLANFDTIRTEYFRDATVQLQAFKSGQLDMRVENISKNWATAYDFPAVQNGQVIKDEFRHRLPTGMQAYVMNTRRAIFKDRRVREAMAQVFDFEWLNKNLFYNEYTRTKSYFSNSDLASRGLPQGAELALLEPFRDKLPPEVFTQEYKLPTTDGSGNNREGLRRALTLLEQAGWKIQDQKLVDANGKQMSFEILSSDPTLERVAIPYSQWLSRLGIDVHVRPVDPAQYQRLMDSFDFDMTMDVIAESDFPGNEQRDYWTCAASKSEGGSNWMGVCDPVVDALVDKVISASDIAQLTAATRALDRVLLWSWYSVPNWHLQRSWVAHWNIFGHPAAPVRTGYVFDAWWVDPKLAAALAGARGVTP